ncbi:MAG: addiction module protein [Planctomycetes bacterium]|nr:addiction module protein [Planctomycetota bacterium]MCB9936389.1 addiction module protein [Planctomycetota bacterium]
MAHALESKWYMNLSREQRLELIARIWDSLATGTDLPKGEDLLAECERRLAEMKADPASAISWDELCRQRGWDA